MKASLRTNLYTKKQIILQNGKSENKPKSYDLADCPAMSKYVRLCPKNTAEFLTFEIEDFFSALPATLSIADNARIIFSLDVRNYARFFVNLWKHNDNWHHSAHWNRGNTPVGI